MIIIEKLCFQSPIFGEGIETHELDKNQILSQIMRLIYYIFEYVLCF